MDCLRHVLGTSEEFYRLSLHKKNMLEDAIKQVMTGN
jgi:hypothetical protein